MIGENFRGFVYKYSIRPFLKNANTTMATMDTVHPFPRFLHVFTQPRNALRIASESRFQPGPPSTSEASSFLCQSPEDGAVWRDDSSDLLKKYWGY